jgi:hypothetical protein
MSNEEFMEGGALYQGGTGLVKQFSFKLWDYDGHMPKDSIVAAEMLFQPTDGSNEGKEILIHWSVGNATDYSPDGQANNGFVLALKGQQKLGDGSNYAYFLKKLAETCGMQAGRLSGPNGIHALEGSSITLARVDQPQRAGLDQAPADPTKKKYPRQTYIPTRAQWGWDTGAQPATAGTTATGTRATRRGAAAAAPAAPVQQAATAQNPVTAAAPVNGNGAASSVTADSIIEALLAQGPVAIADLPRLSLEWLTANNITDRSVRLPLSKSMKDEGAVAEMAVVNDWKLEGGVLSIPQ